MGRPQVIGSRQSTSFSSVLNRFRKTDSNGESATGERSRSLQLVYANKVGHHELRDRGRKQSYGRVSLDESRFVKYEILMLALTSAGSEKRIEKCAMARAQVIERRESHIANFGRTKSTNGSLEFSPCSTLDRMQHMNSFATTERNNLERREKARKVNRGNDASK